MTLLFLAFEAEGIDFVVNTGFDAGNIGEFGVALTLHQYLTNQFQTTSASAVVDCKGKYGTSCDPVPEIRSTLRVNWFRNDFDASLLWRHIGNMKAQESERESLFPAFRHVNPNDYFDLTFGYVYNDFARISLLLRNITDEDPPILGNATGSTTFNSGNTFPSLYDTMGRTYSVNLKLTF
jgi:outer membrane receptor protein involved in Fe transport